MIRKAVSVVLVVTTLACQPAARDLGTLSIADSLYHDPTTTDLWSGPVYRPFAADSSRVQIEGALLEGAWHGDFRVYHPNGHVRYEGTFQMGERCGPWTENADSVALESIYEELIREVESMGIYPPCG